MKRVVGGLIFIGSAVLLGFFLSQRPWDQNGPWQAYKKQAGVAEKSRNEMRQAEAKRKELVETKTHVSSRAGREEEARNQGLTKPNETPVSPN